MNYPELYSVCRALICTKVVIIYNYDKIYIGTPREVASGNAYKEYHMLIEEDEYYVHTITLGEGNYFYLYVDYL